MDEPSTSSSDNIIIGVVGASVGVAILGTIVYFTVKSTLFNITTQLVTHLPFHMNPPPIPRGIEIA